MDHRKAMFQKKVSFYYNELGWLAIKGLFGINTITFPFMDVYLMKRTYIFEISKAIETLPMFNLMSIYRILGPIRLFLEPHDVLKTDEFSDLQLLNNVEMFLNFINEKKYESVNAAFVLKETIQ